MSPVEPILSYVIADDHAIIRDAISDAMKDYSATAAGSSFKLAATASNGLEAIASVKTHLPDLLFLDISMPLASGIEIINDIRRWSPQTRILIFTGVTASGLLTAAVEAGVEGLFDKGSPVSMMTDKLELILNGGRHIAPEFLGILEQGAQTATLTDRERQTLNLILQGKTNKETARLLNISPKTVDKHRTSLMAKLEVHSVAQLMARALQDGLIDPG